jgi:hypothetical protein
MGLSDEVFQQSVLEHNYAGHNIVFVVGCPRSGTTYLQKLLAAHPRIRTGQESDVFDLYIGPLLRTWRRELQSPSDGRGGVGLGCYFLEKEFLAVVKEFLMGILQPMISGLQADEIFIEKTPSHALFIEEILELLPKASFIHVLRDARDVVASILAASRSWGRGWAPRNARQAARLWLRHVETIERSKHQIPSGQFYEVRYEELWSTPYQVLKGLGEFIGLEWSDQEIEKAVCMNSFEAAKQGLGTPIPKGGEFRRRTGPVVTDPSDFTRKGVPEGWRQDLSFIEKFWVWMIARESMERVGYSWNFFLS